MTDNSDADSSCPKEQAVNLKPILQLSTFLCSTFTAGSTNGEAAALAGYSWLDYSVGTDSM